MKIKRKSVVLELDNDDITDLSELLEMARWVLDNVPDEDITTAVHIVQHKQRLKLFMTKLFDALGDTG